MNVGEYNTMIVLLNSIRPWVALICVLSLLSTALRVITWFFKLRFLREAGSYFRRVNLINEYIDKKGE